MILVCSNDVQSGQHGVLPEGSRGLSESASDYPRMKSPKRMHPERVPEPSIVCCADFLHPFRVLFLFDHFPGVSAAPQTPATFWQPSGLLVQRLLTSSPTNTEEGYAR